MTGPLHRRLKASLAGAMVAVACWVLLPGTAVDEKAFELVVKGFANPPFFVTGSGKQADPWKLRTFEPTAKTDTRHAPIVVSLGDDPEGFFQSSPPSPVDLAVILSNLQRLGVKNASSSAVLAWSDPDPIGLVALDKVISRFDSLVMAAPLSRGAVPEAMPQSFRNASLPLNAIQGNASLLPAVNRIPVPGVILGRENTLAGFQSLESEKNTRLTPLLARWDDRVVFAFPLLCVMRHLDLPLEGMEIRLGDYIKLSPQGPTVPLDSYGRLAVPLKSMPTLSIIPAEALIDAEESRIPTPSETPIILRDDRSVSEPSTREFSRHVAAVIAAISSDGGLSESSPFPRLASHWEIILLLLTALFPLLAAGLAPFGRQIACIGLVGMVITAQIMAAGLAQTWLPGLPCMAALLTCWIASSARPTSPLAPVPSECPGGSAAPPADDILHAIGPTEISPAPANAEVPLPSAPEPPPATTKKTTARKAAAKKTPMPNATTAKTAKPKAAARKSPTPKKETTRKKTPKEPAPENDPPKGKKRKS